MAFRFDELKVWHIEAGSTGQTVPAFKRFPDIALRSAIEVVACIYLARERKLITDEAKKNSHAYEIPCKMITKLCDSKQPRSYEL